MTELEKMQRAKMYIDKMANGINPIDDTAAPENDVINNVRISRCFFYVSDILRQVIENGGTAKAIDIDDVNIKLNIENEKEEEDFKKLQKAYDLLLEVKSSYYGGNNDTN